MLFEAVSIYFQINKHWIHNIAVGFELFSFMNCYVATSHQKDIDHVMLNVCELKPESALIFFFFSLQSIYIFVLSDCNDFLLLMQLIQSWYSKQH